MRNDAAMLPLVRWRFCFFFVLAAFFACSTDLEGGMLGSTDFFHEGEYVGLLWGLHAYYHGLSAFPLLIHGAMDYIPALIAEHRYGDAHVIVGTRAINVLLTIFCWVLFLDVCYLAVSRARQIGFWLLAVLGVFALLAPKLNASGLDVETAFIGLRDLFLVSTLWCFSYQSRATTQFWRYAWLIVGAISAAVAFFWSYDRGLATVLFVGVIALGLCLNKKKGEALCLVLALALFFSGLNCARVFGSIHENVGNILYWLANGREVFGVGLNIPLRSMVRALVMLLFCGGAIVFFVRSRFYQDKPGLYVNIGLLVIQLVLLKAVLNRPNMPRLTWAIWPSVIMALHAVSGWLGVDFRCSFKLPVPRGSLAGAAFMLFCGVMATEVYLIGHVSGGHGAFISSLHKPGADADVVPEEMNAVGAALRAAPDGCVLNWANEGVMTLLAKRSFCTHFPYAVYVSRGAEARYLDEIKQAAPSTVVFAVAEPSMMNVDGRSMASRLPAVNDYLERTYPQRRQIGRYTLLSK